MRKIILPILIGAILLFTIPVPSLVSTTAEVTPEGEVVEERVVDGQRIVEMIEEVLGDVWETLGLAYLFDIIIDFFRGIWEWMKAVFEAGLESTK
jgi:hypothetical protein